MEIVYRNLSDLKPNPKNPRTADPDAIARLAESIEKNPKFFEARPILLSDRTGELVIIGGERRSEAARLLNLKAAPTILMSGLTEEQEDEIMIRDNTHAGKWDDVKLVSEGWLGKKLKEWGVEQTFVQNHNWELAARISDEDKPEDPSLFYRITVKVPGGYTADKEEIINAIRSALEQYQGVLVGTSR